MIIHFCRILLRISNDLTGGKYDGNTGCSTLAAFLAQQVNSLFIRGIKMFQDLFLKKASSYSEIGSSLFKKKVLQRLGCIPCYSYKRDDTDQ